MLFTGLKVRTVEKYFPNVAKTARGGKPREEYIFLYGPTKTNYLTELKFKTRSGFVVLLI